jgi:hypothetical protein
VSLRGAATVDFTFKRSAPGALEFNSYAGLVALINATGVFAASNPYAGDPYGYGWILIEVVAAGAAGNNSRLIVVTKSLLNGLILKDFGASEDFARFKGGAATATVTPVFSRQAGTNRMIPAQGVDAPSQALAPFVARADIVPGVYALITHGAAVSTTEEFQVLIS